MPGWWLWLSSILGTLAAICGLARAVPPIYRRVEAAAQKLVFKGKRFPTRWTGALLIALCLVLALGSIGISLGALLCQHDEGPIVIDAKNLSERFLLQNTPVYPVLDKACVYGSMTGAFDMPEDTNVLVVEVVIPNHGWGEGLSGPDNSSAQIIVDSQVKEERIDASMPFYLGGYYRYGSGEGFSNSFQIQGKRRIILTINMVGGARLDLEKVILTPQ